MTRIKLCGLSRLQDIETANALLPEYVGFVFAPKSRRCVTRQHAAELKKHLAPGIRAVGVLPGRRPGSGKCGTGGTDDTALCGGCEQRHRDRRGEGP